MKDQILELIASKPKHFSKIIKNSPDLLQWVMKHTLIKDTSLSEMIYSAVYQQSNTCSFGKTKKYNSISTGYIGCGPASVCACTANTVAQSVKKTKQQITPQQQSEINEKRKATNLKKYGVECVAQTEENKEKFRNWYADPANIASNLQRIRQTNLERYGVENCKSLPEVEEKIIATCLAKYGVKNVSQIPSTKAKLRARTAEYKLNKHLIKKGYEKFKNYLNSNYNFSLLTDIFEYLGVESRQEFLVECNKCLNQKTIKFFYQRGVNCDHCDPKIPVYTSKEEQAVFDYIVQDLGIKHGKQSDKTLINPFEVDMIFPEERISVEYCGLYWHSEMSADKKKFYHYEKMKRVNAAGYRLITIFSDEWNLKNNIVKSKLKNIFQKTENRYFARNLTVQSVSWDQSKEFLNKNHLQGSSSAKINLGLYDRDNLVALMTFSTGRAALNSHNLNSNEYELVRFVTNGGSVIGGASKLLKHFIKNYSPEKIISYSDNRWSDGNLYQTLGFRKISDPTIGYWYVDEYKHRIHRYNFTKNQLIKEGNDPSKTEWEIMQDLGYDRIWDCGHQKFVLDCITDK
jgi:hypothetical protein